MAADVREIAIAAMMEMIRDDLAALGIHHDVFFSERSLMRTTGHDRVAAAIDGSARAGLVYEGRLPPPKGQCPRTGRTASRPCSAPREFGDDVDRPLLKSDGAYTYFASDIAYHRTSSTAASTS